MVLPWIIVLAIAIVIGWGVSFLMRRVGMGAIVCIPVAMIGAVLGGLLHHIYNPEVNAAFYGLSLLLCVMSLGGGIYAFFLTSSERRV